MEESTSTEGIDIPSYFLCPISLEMMKDPVTLPTGITYDRESIERWMFTGRHCSCPVTKQPVIPDSELMIPNHTLRRLIQSWCAANAEHGVERLPTPRPPINKAQIVKIMEEGVISSASLAGSLCKLKEIVVQSESNRRCAEAAGVVDFLVSVILHRRSEAHEALHIVNAIRLSDEGYRELVSKNEDFVEVLVGVMKDGDDRARASAVLVLKSLSAVLTPARLAALREDVFVDLVRLLEDMNTISYRATKAALKVLSELCRWGRNRIKAARAGAVGVMIELLISGEEMDRRRTSELALVVLDEVCRCAEGRAAVVGHAAGMAAVGRTMLGLSPAATASSVRVLHSLFRFSATTAVVNEAAQVGVVAKLCMVVQLVGLGGKTKERAVEILRLHARVWKNSPCVPSFFPLNLNS